jgi:hypothetical protein
MDDLGPVTIQRQNRKIKITHPGGGIDEPHARRTT